MHPQTHTVFAAAKIAWSAHNATANLPINQRRGNNKQQIAFLRTSNPPLSRTLKDRRLGVYLKLSAESALFLRRPRQGRRVVKGFPPETVR